MSAACETSSHCHGTRSTSSSMHSTRERARAQQSASELMHAQVRVQERPKRPNSSLSVLSRGKMPTANDKAP